MTEPAAEPAPDPASLRRDYTRAELTETAVAPDWSQQLLAWFDAAAEDLGSVEANAVQLATVDASGHPSVRTVLAKGISGDGVVFFTNYDSAKGHDLDERPYASLVFVWLAHERQVRLSGAVERVTRAETDAYFASRPRGSQIGAWASPQSEVVADRAVLDDAWTAAEQRFEGRDVPAPPNWGGYRLRPDAVEFWQGRTSRLHDRLRYRLDAGSWVLERLAP